MLMLSLICLLAGAVLGQKFKVLVLIPAMMLAFVAAVGFNQANTFREMIGAVLAAMTSVQIGYFAGVGIHYVMAAGRASRMHASTLATSTSPEPFRRLG